MFNVMKRALKLERYNFNMVVIKTRKEANIISFQSVKEKERNDRNQNPECALWKAVIMQAVLDVMSNSKRASEILAKNTARDWLSEKNANFIKVCGYAGLSPNWVIKKIEYALENPRIWRRECDLKNFFSNKKS
jgi:hypothetical protein